MNNWFNIVLYKPEIPANTGNISRLCVGLNCKLHLIEPLGFKLTDKAVKRAGLDYWEHLKLERHASLNDFFAKYPQANFYYATTKASKTYFEVAFKADDFVIFGQETAGMPAEFHDKYKERGITIPMPGKVRSINLSNSAAIIAYEALRQIKY